MRYWVYSQGSIQGPYHESSLAGVSGFGPDSLVCPEDKAGSQPSDWRRAGSIPALSMLVSPRAFPPASAVPADVRFSGGPEPWLAPSEDSDPDILSQLDEYWTRYRSGPEDAEPNVGRIENRVFELEQRLQSFDLDQKALLKKLTEKEGLLAELLAKLEPLERRLLDAESAKEQALREMRHEMDRIKEELRRKEDELRLLRSSPELGGAWQAPSLAGGPMDLESYLAALEKSLGTGELPAAPTASAFAMPAPPELVIPPVPGFGEAGLPPSETLPPVSMPAVPAPRPVDAPPVVAAPPVPEPVVEIPPAPVIETPFAPAAPTPPAPAVFVPPPPAMPVPAVEAAPEPLTIVEMKLAPSAKKLQGEFLPPALLAPPAPAEPAKALETAPPAAAITGPAQGVMEAFHLPPAPTAPPPPTTPPPPQVTMPRLTASAPFVPVPKLTPPPPLIPEAPSGRITSPITSITPAHPPAAISAKPEMTEVLAKLGKKPDALSGAVPPPAPPPAPSGAAVPGASAAPALASAAPAAAAPAPAWMTKIPPLAKFWTSITKKKAAPKAPAAAGKAATAAAKPATAASVPPPAPAPSLAGATSAPQAPAGATVAAPPKAAPKKGGQKTFLLVFGLGVVAVGIVFAVFLFRDQRELGPSSAEQAKAVPAMETGLPAKSAPASKAANPMASASSMPAAAPAPMPAAATTPAPASPFPTAETSPAPQAPPAAAPAPAAKPAFQLPPGADALQLTKNYSLGPGRGSLGLYLTKQFLASGSDDLMEDWSSSEMQSGVYLVEYKVLHLLPDGRAQRLSNYIFEVDVRKKTVAGYNSGARMILGAPQAAAPQ